MDMKDHFFFTFITLLILGSNMAGCETFCGKCYCDSYDAQAFTLNDTLEMKFGEVYCNPEKRIRLTFTAFEESRCPIGVYCVWEGYARTTFSLDDKKDDHSEFVLHTLGAHEADTIIQGLRIELLGLAPYPVIDVEFPQSSYTATIAISE
jgi:hypothetical protein